MKINAEYCASCGKCCFLGLHRKNTNYKGIEIGEDGWFIHYDPDKKCTKYEARLQVCKDFKFDSDKCWMFIDFVEDWIEEGVYLPKRNGNRFLI